MQESAGLREIARGVWHLPPQQERDRPQLAAITGRGRGVQIDAGASPAHHRLSRAALALAPAPYYTPTRQWSSVRLWAPYFGDYPRGAITPGVPAGVTGDHRPPGRGVADW